MQPTKFIHMADCHLGFKQYRLNERFIDYNRAFNSVLNRALKENVDFILIAGDLFNSNNVDPETLTAIYQMISLFKQHARQELKKDIPIICVEGNHDKGLYSSTRSWMTFLEDLNLIIILKPEISNDQVIFHTESNHNSKRGMIRIKDVCIYGVPYQGASTKQLFPYIYNAIPDRDDIYTILMMHFGITGQVKDKMGFTLDKSIMDLHDKVDYLALGHFHKMYLLPEKGSWIFNPGSIEINDVKEVWGIKNEPYDRGVFLMEVRGKKYYERKIRPILCSNGPTDDPDKITNRYFHQASVDISLSELTTFKKTATYIMKKLKQLGLPRKKDEDDIDLEDRGIPFLIFSLFGTLNYSKMELDIPTLREMIQEEFNLLGLRIFSSTLSSVIEDAQIGGREGRSIEKIEQDVFSTFIDANAQYAPHKNNLLTLLGDLKSSLLSSKMDSKKVTKEIIAWWESHLNQGFEQVPLNTQERTTTSNSGADTEFSYETVAPTDETRPTGESESPEDNQESLESDLDDLLEEDFDF